MISGNGIRSASETGRLQWIDSLRGLAAIGVAIMHLFERLREYYPGNSVYQKGSIGGFFILDFINLGKLGVVVFFMISGFVVPFSLYNKDLREFALTRFFRLYPAYWFSLLAFIVVMGMPDIIHLIGNITMFQKFVGIPDLVGVYWTLQIELIFYFICAGLFYFNILHTKKTIVFGYYLLLLISLAFAAVRYVLEKKVPVALPLGLSAMFLGMLWKMYSSGDGIIPKRFLNQLIILFVVVLLPTCFLAYNKDYGFDEKWYKYFVSYILAISIFGLFFFKKWSNAFLSFLGMISYSLYLLHPIALEVLSIIKQKHWVDMSSSMFILLFTLLMFSISMIGYFLVEKPAIKLGKKMLRKMKDKRRAVNPEQTLIN